MHVGVLGPLRVIDDDGAVEIAAPMQRALLALLAIHVGEVISTDRILEALWGDEQPAGGVKTLRYHVSKLREALGDASHEAVATEPPGYVLSRTVSRVDAAEFRRLVADARLLLASDPTQAHTALLEALELWRGPALAEFEYREFARSELRRLEEERLQAVEMRVRADLTLGRHGEVIPELVSLVDEHPYREALRGFLITALYRAGRQTEALRAYQDIRKLLGEELGIEPSPELAALEEQVLLHDESLDAPARTVRSDVVRTNLPSQLTSFVGREAELAAVEDLVAGARLVTLTGAGGSGKTRLALEAAQRVAAGFRDGVWLVELGRVGDPALVPQAIADALGVQASAGVDTTETLSGALKVQTLLLVLDNFEHVIDSAPLISTLLGAAPDLRVLVTSRERLRLSGEHVYRVPPLAQPDATSLFVQQARAVRSDFHLTDDNAADIEAICRDLDGLPLAIELAAARVNLLAPAALRERLSSRLATLTRGLRDHPARQQTLRNTIDWSYDMLQPQEQRLFASLTVFMAGRSLEAVEAVCAPDLTLDVLDGLQSLTDKSLIRQRTGPDGGPRFFLLETLHEYARELLDTELDTRAIRQRHCDYFVELADRAAIELEGADSDRWHEMLNADLENLRAALAWAFRDGDPLQGCRLLGALHRFWWNEGHLGEVEAWEHEALRHADALEPLARARLYSVLMFVNIGKDTGVARSFQADALKWAQAAGDVHAIAQAMMFLAMTYMDDLENYDRAMSQCREALDMARATDDKGLAGLILSNIGILAMSNGNDKVAARAFGECLHISQETGDRRRATLASFGVALLEDRKSHKAAEHLAAEGLRAAWDLDSRMLIATGLEILGVLAVAAERTQRGARLIGAALRALEAIAWTGFHPVYDRVQATLAQQLEPAELEAFMAEGRVMTLPEAVAYALEENAT